MWGGNHQCLSFYYHDIVCSLEENGLRKMGLFSFPILPKRNQRTKPGFSLSFLVRASITKRPVVKGPQSKLIPAWAM